MQIFALPVDIYVQLAGACEEVQTQKFEGSGVLVRAKICCFCGHIVKLGAGSADSSLHQHMLSKKCQATQQELVTAGSPSYPLSDESKPPQAEMSSQKLDKPLTLQTSFDLDHSYLRPLARLDTMSTNDNSTTEGLTTCPGAFVSYGLSMFSHYPWHLHDSTLLDYEFSSIDPKGQFFYVQSRKCYQKSPGNAAPCAACNQIVISRQFQELLKRADPARPLPLSLNLQFRTHAQLCKLLQEKNSQINTLQLHKLTMQRDMRSLSGRIDEQKRLMLAISQHDEFAVGRIIQTALRNGAGVKTIIDRLVKAHQGLFSPHSYSQNSLDVSALLLKIGGPRLGFAMAKAMHLPSVSTVHSRLNLPQLIPCVGFPTIEHISTNIQSFFGLKAAEARHCKPTGVSLMLDELANEPRPRFSMLLDAVVGICREHADMVSLDNLSTRSDPLSALLEGKSALDSGRCHRAAEVTMAAIAQFGESDYNASVILVSPTCKTEKAPEHAHLIGALLDSWRQSPYGEALHGNIWSICTDGDPGRRLAIFQHCMTTKLSPDSDLFRILGQLPLLNLFCRFASALRSRSGILVNGAHITPKMLVHYLRGLDNLSESRILSFFDGTDPQNVPKANALLAHLDRASCLPNVTSQSEHKPFALLGKVLSSFIQPYTILTMSLTQQMTSLAKCAHLLFALYRIDGTKFLPGQLIYDIQASIKNAYFCVAKTQLIDPNLPFYLLQTGTDRLEARFGTYRTVTSDRNGDVLQMCERAASAQHIDEIFSAHPRWNWVPYRLSLDGKSGIDHTNPSSWTGDVAVGHVDLLACWLQGQCQAAEALKLAGAPFEFDPATLVAESPQIDLMRPSGKYPGIQVDNIEPDLQPVLPSELVDSDTALFPNTSSSCPDGPTVVCNTHSMPLRLGDDELGIEHMLPATLDEQLEPKNKRGWILIDGQHIHLESAVQYYLGSEGGAKSTDRLRRVCGFTRYLHPSAQTNSVLGNDFHVSELAATLIRVDNQVVLAIVRVTNIVAKDGRSLESISEQHFLESGVTLSGQLLELEYDSGVWYWTQRYDLAADTATSAHRKRHSGIDFEARFSLAVNPLLVERNDERIWAFNDAHMHTLMDDLWASCIGKSPEDHIPVCQPSRPFPYHISDRVLFHQVATNVIQNAIPPTEGKCFLCDEHVKIKQKMRVHVGKHLLTTLASSNGINAGLASDSHLSPCGFCGRQGTCITTAERQPKAIKAIQVISNCPYKDKFTYSVSPRSSKTSPCTNRPIECPRCPTGSKHIWSYTLRQHVHSAHGSEALGALGEELKKYDPTDEEFLFMQVDQKTGSIQSSARSRKRKRETGPSHPILTNSSSTRRKRS